MPKEEKTIGSITFLNRGKRRFHIGFDADKKPVIHMPGFTMLYTAEQAEAHQGYADLIDISKLPGQVNTKQLESDNKRLLAEKESLEKQLAALQPVKKGRDRETAAA